MDYVNMLKMFYDIVFFKFAAVHALTLQLGNDITHFILPF